MPVGQQQKSEVAPVTLVGPLTFGWVFPGWLGGVTGRKHRTDAYAAFVPNLIGMRYHSCCFRKSVAFMHCRGRFACAPPAVVIGSAVLGEPEGIGSMAFTIHASKGGHVMQTLRLDPRSAADKARALLDQGWEVHVTNQSGQRYSFDAQEGLEPAVPS
jgi:hypothetical protein